MPDKSQKFLCILALNLLHLSISGIPIYDLPVPDLVLKICADGG
jgi:hypothetical protein